MAHSGGLTLAVPGEMPMPEQAPPPIPVPIPPVPSHLNTPSPTSPSQPHPRPQSSPSAFGRGWNLQAPMSTLPPPGSPTAWTNEDAAGLEYWRARWHSTTAPHHLYRPPWDT